jgi:hypothetical protein
MQAFIHSFQSEWIKRRRSLASWIVIAGGFFTPAIIIVARIVNSESMPKIYASERFWNMLWRTSWESMAIFLLPIGVILATSLITQIEYKNNTWKQVHTVPLTLTTIFFSKLGVILIMLIQFFILFNIGIYLSAVIPYLVINDLTYPQAIIPVQHFVKENLFYFVDCLPIVALQYLISLQYRNFLVPVGVGFLLWIGAVGILKWKYGFILPYTYGMFNYLKDMPDGKAIIPTVDIHLMALAYFVLFILAGYALYVLKKEKI